MNIVVQDLIDMGLLSKEQLEEASERKMRESTHRFVQVLCVSHQLAQQNIQTVTFTGHGNTPADAEAALLANWKTNAFIALKIHGKLDDHPRYVRDTLDADIVHDILVLVNRDWIGWTANRFGYCMKD